MDHKAHVAAGIRSQTHFEKKGGIALTDVDRIYEAALADEWEEQNRPERDSFPDWDKAVKKLQIAFTVVCAAVAQLEMAKDMIEGSTQEDRIGSLQDDMEALAVAIYGQRERMR